MLLSYFLLSIFFKHSPFHFCHLDIKTTFATFNCDLCYIITGLLPPVQAQCWSERSACAALGRCCGTKCQLYLVLFFLYFFLLLCHILFSQKGLSQGYEILHRVLSHKKNKIWGKQQFRDPPSTLGVNFLVFLFSCK